MQQASEIAKAVARQQSIKSSSPLPSETQQRPKLSQPMLDTLWLKMAEIYGRTWTGSFGVSADQSHAWATILGDLTGKQLACGLAALTDKPSDFPPSATSFRALCLAGEVANHNLPSESDAYREACEHAHPAGPEGWSHMVVRHAALTVGYWDLMNRPAEETRKTFAKVYAKAIAELLAGREFPEPARSLPAEVVIHATPAEARAAREELFSMFKGPRNG